MKASGQLHVPAELNAWK